MLAETSFPNMGWVIVRFSTVFFKVFVKAENAIACDVPNDRTFFTLHYFEVLIDVC